MKNQYEQQCNAAALKQLGVPVVKKLRKKTLEKVERWLDEKQSLDIHFPDIAGKAVEKMMGKAEKIIKQG